MTLPIVVVFEESEVTALLALLAKMAPAGHGLTHAAALDVARAALRLAGIDTAAAGLNPRCAGAPAWALDIVMANALPAVKAAADALAAARKAPGAPKPAAAPKKRIRDRRKKPAAAGQGATGPAGDSTPVSESVRQNPGPRDGADPVESPAGSVTMQEGPGGTVRVSGRVANG